MAYRPAYQDILSSTMGKMAPSATTSTQAGFDIQRNLVGRQFNRDNMLRQYTRTRGDIRREADERFRQLPGAYNRRGMMDSGRYVGTGRQMAADLLRAQNRLREDYNQGLTGSYMEDQLDLGNLAELRQTLASQDYQALVAGLYGDRMRGA